MSDERPTVLVVEDEPELAELYATWLESGYDVLTALGGREALEELDEGVDLVLLDRRMPDLPGDEVLDAIRERGIDCRVAMVTAVEPDFDIIAMGFDDYLVKPVSKETLRETVEELRLRDSYDSGVQELFSLASKKALLESELEPTALANNEEYRELEERLSSLRATLDERIDQIDETVGFDTLFQELDDDDVGSGDGGGSR